MRQVETDLVVVGGGGAGLAAALAAAEMGTRVTLLEKRGLGGNSALAFGIFAVDSPTQKREHIECRPDDCFQTAMDWAHWRINASIVRALIDKSGDTVRWLEEKGLEFECGAFNPDQLPVFHKPKGRGAALIKTLTQKCRDQEVQLLIRTPAKKILTDKKGNVTGVLAESKEEELTIAARSVIIATGGYAGNKQLLKKYCPDYHDGMERIGLAHTGDGLLMAMEIGAATEGLGILLLGMPSALHPPDLVVKTERPPDLNRIGLISIASEPRTIWVNKKGKRFADEDFNNTSIVSSNAIVQQPDNTCYTLWDSEITRHLAKHGPKRGLGTFKNVEGDKLPKLVEELRAQAEKGLVKIFDSWAEMADWIGADRQVLKTTIDEYNAACDRGYDPLFAKNPKYLLPLRTPPYYAIKWHSSYLNSIGGIKINEHMGVLDKQDNPIPGLFAAGVDTGGWESGTYCMLLPGHAFGFAVNSGRIAGENAARFIKGK